MCLRNSTSAFCACSDGFELSGNLCIQKNNTTPSLCPPKHFKCLTDFRCIPEENVCNGETHCSDGSDESDEPGGVCEHFKCSESNFRCDNNTCIPQSWLCDSHKDCKDGSDESSQQCPNRACKPHEFQCEVSKKCIPVVWKCDLSNDCGPNDFSDETGCGKFYYLTYVVLFKGAFARYSHVVAKL